ncbi:MAG: 16S rRNA (guanine(966)-N(2))-methyltransferase RsmD [Negativicutes bacterium]|nr:16S rRNA (guanine(966)-N(2))-methyltransferase RsmD [Negativicutes bacterium]
MRIITGTAKGRKLKAPKGLMVRPTADRVKESVFNIIADRIYGAEVLDLFAGTGNLGLEALSRGAASAVFVDNAPASLAVLKSNAEHTRLAERSHYIRADALKAVDILHSQGRLFDLIFCDPPYNKGHVVALLQQIEARLIVKPTGLLIIEHSRHEPVTSSLVKLQVVRTEQYGETVVSFLTVSV